MDSTRLNLRVSFNRLSRLIFGSLLVYAWLAPPAQAEQSEPIGTVTNEGFTLSLVAPEGQVFTEVLFASYGTPNGFQIGWCHSSSSLQIVESLVLGQSSVVIPSSNQIFGDPCPGTYKRLAVILAVSPDLTSTTSTSTTIEETTTSGQDETTTIVIYESSTTSIETEADTTTVLVETTWAESTNPTTTDSFTVPIPNVPAMTEAPLSTTLTTSSEVSTTMSSQPESSAPPSSAPLTTSASETSTAETEAPSEPTLSPVEPSAVPPGPEAPSVPVEPVDSLPETTTTVVTSSTSIEIQTAPPNDASQEQKRDFEEQVNVFDGGFDDYIPAGSNVTVGQRRTIIAVTAATTLLAPLTSQRRRG